MAEEIQEAVQILRVTFDGVEIAMKVGSGGMAAMKKAVDVLKGMLDYEKLLGKTSMRKLLIRGGDLQVFQFPTKEIKKVKKMAKKYGVLYSMLPNVNKADGMSEIIFHSEAVPRVNMMIKKLQVGKLSSFEEFLKEGDEKGLGKLTDFLQEQTREHISDDPGQDRLASDAVDKALTQTEEIQDQAGYEKELADRVRVVAKSRDPNLMDVTVSRTLIAEESETAVKTRIPGTWGEGARFIWIPKADIMDIYNGRTMLTFLDRTKDYQIYDKNDRIAETINGEKLYGEHYDRVEAAVRERYEKELKRRSSESRAHVRAAKAKRGEGMQITKKKPSWVWIILGACLFAYLGYLFGGAWKEGMQLADFLEACRAVRNAPFENYINENTWKAVVIALLVYAAAVLMYCTGQKNYMPGKEYGTARFADVRRVNQVLEDKDPGYNRILSRHVRMSLDTRHTKLNNNVLIIGGSGAGKTFYEVKPNLMQMPHHCSFICTDPKGEILRSCGQMLKDNGYRVKVINLLEMDRSDGYNPFSYLREETDVVKLITNLIANTTPKGSTPTDPFWEKAEGLFLQAIFYYVWLEEKPEKRNFRTVLKLLGEAEVAQQGVPSRLDVRMKLLEESSPLGEAHPAVKQYNKCMRGAGDTIRSIIISANSRLAYLENDKVLRLLSRDDMNLAELGIGVNGDRKTRTALFCVIPDSDKSYNFIIGMLYTQIFQELYYQADFHFGGRLPIHVTFMLDEFSNVALPDDFCSLLSTMRSREISSVIIIQNMAQIKALFKDTWETIPGNCDTLIYLGGNEQSTHKYVSELLGKSTIDKRSNGETLGRQGSSNRNYDVLGRELMTPDEARKFDNRKCLIFIRGFDPIVDDKYIPFRHPAFSLTADGKGAPYVHQPVGAGEHIGKTFELLSPEAVSYYEQKKEEDENVHVDTVAYEKFQALTAAPLPPLAGEDTITNRLVTWQYSSEQKEELKKMLALGMPKAGILDFFYPDIDVGQMKEIREDYEQRKGNN